MKSYRLKLKRRLKRSSHMLSLQQRRHINIKITKYIPGNRKNKLYKFIIKLKHAASTITKSTRA